MLAAITSFFESCLKPDKADTPASTADKLHLACAALMLELCQADQSMDDSEQRILQNILKRTFNLNEAALTTLWDLAHAEARNATSLFQFTSLINESYAYPEKVRLLQYMWEVARADGRIDRYEEHLIRKIADLLYLTHGDFIRAKLTSKQQD